MGYLEDYVTQIEESGQAELAASIKNTATEVGRKHLSKFDYRSNQIGLLFGNIQSGKTGQVFGIACEAADLSFPFFLLLTTDNVLLQEQTYVRAKRDLPGFVVCSEGDEETFRSHGEKPVLVVLKKNTRILKSWAGTFKNSAMLKGNPLFIIDDEADAASLNTQVNQKKVSSIHKYLNMIRETSLSSVYLQVTGTPQALLLQTQQSDWHPMFTEYFKPGRGYLGGDFFFPETGQVPSFVHFVDKMTPAETARKVVLRHLVVSAQTLLSGGKVSNCLVHPGTRQITHAQARKEIEDALAAWTYDHDSKSFNDSFATEYDAMNPTKSVKQSYDAVLKKVNEMLRHREYSLVTLNGTSIDGSEQYQTGCNFVFGGTSLGRGVTFAQLSTFYYTRSSQNPQADTMWQHSRMFGYDRDPGLVSFYSSQNLYGLFAEINATNTSIINQVKAGKTVTIAYPEGLSPTRTNVLDKSVLNILVGGSNHFPVYPKNHSIEDLDELLASFSDHEPAVQVNLKLIEDILAHLSAEKTFNLQSYAHMIAAARADNSLAQGWLLVRRNRDITRATRALLSPNDWAETNQYKDQFVLTMYRVLGQVDKGWQGHPVWVPNIKLPQSKNFYIV